MSFTFLGGKKPSKLARSLDEEIKKLEENEGKLSPKNTSKKGDKITSLLNDMCIMLYGEVDGEAKPDNMKKLIPELLDEDTRLLIRILARLGDFELQARKNVEKMCCWMLRRGKQNNTLAYFDSHREIFDILVQGYESDIAFQCGPILRACIDHKDLCYHLLHSEHFFKFFAFMQNENFDIASDAFDTFRLLLTKHKTTASKFLDQNYEDVLLERYNNELLISDNFVTRRQSLQLLYEIFKEPKCHKIMKKYIADPHNLKLIMNRFMEKSVVMQYAVFHVFKFFVANNRQPPQISRTLYRNRSKLVHLLNALAKEDARFLEEKQMLLDVLNKLEAPLDRTKSEELEQEQVVALNAENTDSVSKEPSKPASAEENKLTDS